MSILGRIFTGLAIATLSVALVVAGLVAIYSFQKKPLPLTDQCVARIQEQSVALDTEQTRNATIIVGVATRRGLAPRASTISLATVYQESGIRNLDYGDRDSLGLFQQRPSQGWGTQAQVQDPYYASNKFYAALVKVKGWASGDINDVAQAVQRSGHPKGYVRHVENARQLASALTGETPASFTCLVKKPPPADPEGMALFLSKTLPGSSQVKRDGPTIKITAKDSRAAWSAAHIAVGNTAFYGAAKIQVGSRSWTPNGNDASTWVGEPDQTTTVTITYPDQQPTPGS